MILGQKYLEVKNLLSETLDALGNHELKREADASTWQGLHQELDDPFLILFAGEVNAGKSTLINALLHQPIIPAGVLPTTQKTIYLHHGDALRESDPTPELKTIAYPSELLKDCHFLDTPGIDGVESRHVDDAQRLIPHSDAVIFVLSATQPWSQASWRFLTQIHQEHLKEVLIVLQQADTRTPEEIEAILDYIQVLSQKKLGIKLPTFAISAKTLLQSPEQDASPSWSAFQHALSELLAKRAPKWKRLRHIAWTARKRITKKAESLQKNELDIQRGWKALNHAQSLLQTHLQHYLQCWKTVQTHLEEIYRDFIPHAQDSLASRLGFQKSLQSLKTPDEPDQLIQQRLTSSLQKNSAPLIRLTLSHWDTQRQHFIQRLKSHIASEPEIHAFHVPDEMHHSEVESMTKSARLGAVLEQFTHELDFPSTLRTFLRLRTVGTVGFTMAILLSILGIIAGWLRPDQSFLLSGSIVALVTLICLSLVFGHHLKTKALTRMTHRMQDHASLLSELIQQWSSGEAALEMQRLTEGYEAARFALNRREEEYLEVKEHLDEHHKKLADVEQQAEKKLAA